MHTRDKLWHSFCRLLETRPLEYRCYCSRARMEKALIALGKDELTSMIEDEIKTIDDAINEASIEMRMDKEQNYK